MDVNGLRDGNVGIKNRITETDASRADAIQNLKMLQMERDRKANMIDTMKDDYQKKIEIVRQLESEQF